LAGTDAIAIGLLELNAAAVAEGLLAGLAVPWAAIIAAAGGRRQKLSIAGPRNDRTLPQ
jgi:hypothetical protein